MKISLKIKLILLVICIFSIVANAQNLDWLNQYNIIWDSQSDNSAASMPCGGGDIGLNVWAEKGELLFYIQRSGSLAENNQYLKLGRIRLEMTPNPFAGKTFKQELKLKQGFVEIQAQSQANGKPLNATVKVWVNIKDSTIYVDVDSSQNISVDAAYENWRLEDRDIPNNLSRRPIFSMEAYPGKITLSKDTISSQNNSIIFYHRNPDNKIIPEVLIKQQGLEKYKDEIVDDLKGRTFGGAMLGTNFKTANQTTDKYQVTPYKAWHLISTHPAQKHQLRIVTHIAQTETIDQWRTKLNELIADSANNIENKRQATQSWWKSFWQRSWISINPDKPDPSSKPWRIARNYNLFRYQLGCNAFGEYPTKFNGGNFTVDGHVIGAKGKNFGPDWRDWGGGVFTAQNQRLLHWPMLKAGDFDAILPNFELYRKALGGSRARVKAHFGHDGAVYSEYISVPGVAIGAGWGWEGGSRNRGTEVPFGDPRADGAQGYNSFVEPGVMANNCIGYHWESQLENAYMIMEYHRFTGADISKYMPFIENALIFFDEHYRLREKMRTGKELNNNGKLVIFPSTSCESYRGAKNPSDVLAGLKAGLESILTLDDNILKLRDKKYYRQFLNSIPDFAFDNVNGDKTIKPAESWKRYQNVECPQFYPLFPFNRFDLQGKDSDYMQTFRNTWKHGNFPKNMVISWHQDGIFYARMGMTEQAASYNIKKLDDSPRRYPTFWGPGHDWVPDHNWGGSGMIGLQEMLIQTIGKEIYLFPAWPKDWDVNFKLHAPYQTTIEGQLKDGKIQSLTVTPESRKSDIKLIEFK
ncbi:MAG: hypothetical protein JEZ07_00085 [Phycisphaerae bacterium]|nr:hypothetical protein [Phycisphaerae bacterium]